MPGSLQSPPPFRLAVVNPGGRDPEQAFPYFAGPPKDREHPPVNHHAYAACTAGTFHRHVSSVPHDAGGILLLLRRDLYAAARALTELHRHGFVVAVALKEAGAHQVATNLADRKRLAIFRDVCTRADFCLASNPDLIPLYLGAGARRVEFIPTPYPLDDPRWDFSRSIEPAATMGDRRGVFIGTREFAPPSRNHLAALVAARLLGEPVTVINTDGGRGRRLLAELGFQPITAKSPAFGASGPELQTIEGQMDYQRYLQVVAGHRIVFQLDRSAVPGQVAGDALLCRVPCVGGDGAVERLSFPELCSYGHDTAYLVEQARRLLRDDDAYAQAIDRSQRLAHQQLAFAVVAPRLKEAFEKGRTG